jgi:hypothetical protein
LAPPEKADMSKAHAKFPSFLRRLEGETATSLKAFIVRAVVLEGYAPHKFKQRKRRLKALFLG